MSSVTGLSTSDSASYAAQLAQTSSLKRSLNNLGVAVQNGDLTSANSILTAFIKANPQYASTQGDATQSQDPINGDFQALADAISNNQVDAAKNAWTQVKSDLSQDGVTDITDGTTATAELLAETKASIEQQIVSDAFGTSSAGALSATSLLGGSGISTGGAGLSTSLLSDWLTYQSGGQVSPVPANATGTNLDTVA
jgi:hypothetical protein